MTILQRLKNGAASARRSARAATGNYPIQRDVHVADYTCTFEATTPMEEYRIQSIGDEHQQLERFLELVAPDTQVWDVGANIGLYSLFSASAGGHVVAFEPDPAFVQRLHRNRELTGVPLHVADVALWNHEDRLTLQRDGLNGASPALTTTRDGEYTTRVVRGDEWGTAPDVVKIDVEGAEARVLQGLAGLLPEIDAVFLEIHPELLAEFGDSEWQCKELLLEYGFEETWRTQRDGQYHVLYQQ